MKEKKKFTRCPVCNSKLHYGNISDREKKEFIICSKKNCSFIIHKKDMGAVIDGISKTKNAS